MKLGFIGLGRMGSPMVGRLLAAGHEVVVYGRHADVVQPVVEQGATAAEDVADLVRRLGPDPVVWLMIPAGAVDDMVAELSGLMTGGGTIVDGGNSNFQDTRRRAARTAEHGVRFIDVGTSGGVLGAKEGYSLMIGGDRDAALRLQPLYEALAQASGWAYFGPSGAGHYLKMVHNAIEYGMMEAYAEGYHLLKDSQDYADLDLDQAAQVWQHGSIIASKLNGVIDQALTANPTLDGVDGYVAETGEARWTLETAKAQEIPMPAIQAAMDVRLASQRGHTSFATKLLAAMRNVFGGHQLNQ